MKGSRFAWDVYAIILALLRVPSYDLLLFFLAGFAFHRSRLWLLGGILAFGAEKVTMEWGAAILSREHSHDASAWFTTWFGGMHPRFSGELREIQESSLSTLVPRYALDLTTVIGKGRKLIDKRAPTQTMRVFVAVPEPGEPEIGGHRSYSSFYSTSLIILRDYPSLDDPMSVFPLYHEIGHLTAMGIIANSRRHTRMISACFTVLVVAFALGLSWLLAPLLIWFALRVIRTLDMPTIETEMYADCFALSLFNNRDKIQDVIDCHKEAWREVALRPIQMWGNLDAEAVRTRFARSQETTILAARLTGMEKFRTSAEKGNIPVNSSIIDSSYVVGYVVMCAAAYKSSYASPYLLAAMGVVLIGFVMLGPLSGIYQSVRIAEQKLDSALTSYLSRQTGLSRSPGREVGITKMTTTVERTAPSSSVSD